MKLISHVEVAYFRSFYKDQLTNCTDTNVIFGRNDSGKSNLLRALNLFFNNKTNPGQPFRFDRDFSHARRAEAEEAEGVRKFAYVKIWFNTPANWRASLGDSFWVKKQWSVTTQSDPNFYSSITEQRLQQYLTRFLNKVRFHYVPAIKDRKIFEHLQTQIYDVISAHAEFRGSLTEFADALRLRTVDLSAGLLAGLGINSVVSTPQDLTDLFRSLDFETTSEAGDAYSLTLQRGDGVQVRHIPPILAFLSDRAPGDHHVWGFEEPENSLELANAISEAETFRTLGRHNNKQIFLTSHSPAFFSLEGEDVRRYFVSRSSIVSGRICSVVRVIDNPADGLPSELMGETPHLPVISAYLKDAHEKIRRQDAIRDELQRQIAERDQSILFVEGDSDCLIVEAAWNQFLRTPMPFRIESAGGTSRMESLGSDGRVLAQLAPQRKVLVLVDNDAEGRRAYKHGRLDGGARWVRHNSNGVHWCRLPIRAELQQLMQQMNIPNVAWPGTLENLFSPHLRQEALTEGALGLHATPHAELLEPAYFEAILPYLGHREDLNHYFVLCLTPESKMPFARWLVARAARDQQVLEPLRPVVEGISRIFRDA